MASPGGPFVDEARLAPISLVAVGASPGGVETLQRLVAELDGQLRVAVAVVLHLPSGAHSVLPDILGRCSSVPCAHVADDEPLVAGHIYVAPPDCHLVIEGERFRLTRDENDHRPAIDPLLRLPGALPADPPPAPPPPSRRTPMAGHRPPPGENPVAGVDPGELEGDAEGTTAP